jgi:hypothetical protein
VPPWVDPDTHGWLFSPTSDDDWQAVVKESGGGSGFARIAARAREMGCRTVVIENRYVDADYRSDFAAFWSRQFGVPSPFTRRVHFFRSEFAAGTLPDLPADPQYLGYSVVRPSPHQDGHVGRTVLAAPDEPANAVLAAIEDEVSLFGNRLTVRGVPFVEQDGEFLRCAHAAIWVCHYTAVRRGLVPRTLTADLVTHVPKMLSANRTLPSPGLNVPQMQAVFEATGQPALLYSMDRLPSVLGVENPAPEHDPDNPDDFLPPGCWDTRIFSIICRYLNSGFPVIALTGDHAIVLVGWFQDGDMIRFLACDDQGAPYEVIESPFTDTRAPWLALMVPLPPKVMMSGERAENRAYYDLQLIGNNPKAPASWQQLTARLTATPKGVSLRTFLRDVNTYKLQVTSQGRDADAVKLLRLGRLPHYVWVVEAQDRAPRERGAPCVLAEILYDPHSSEHRHRDPTTVATSLPGLTVVNSPDGGTTVHAAYAESPWRSHLEA